MTRPTRALAPFIAYLVAFHAAWTAWVYFLYPQMRNLGEATFLYALVNISVRLLVWVVPVWLYLRYVDDVRPADYLKLSTNWRRGIVVGLAATLLNFVASAIRSGGPDIDVHALTWNNVLSTSILIGFIEEVPYRGFMLQKLQERMGLWPAFLISSLLFLGIHFPGWILLRMFDPAVAVSVFIFGLVMGVVFHYSRSLWAVVIAHSLNDFLSVVVFRH